MDTNVFIYAFEFPESNSAKVIALLNKGEIKAFVSTRVVLEVMRYFEKHHGIVLARKFRHYLLEVCHVISQNQVVNSMQEYKKQIKDKDLEQLAVVKWLGLRYLIAYDRDFEKFEEYITPKNFIKFAGSKEADTEY